MEADAIVVHALNIDSGAKRNPRNQIFSSPSGAATLNLAADEVVYAKESVDDGQIIFVQLEILISGYTIMIGKGEGKITPY